MLSREEEIELTAMRWQVDAIRVQVRMLQLRLALRRYDPNQPRMPAGSQEGGQWTRGPTSGVRVAQNVPRDPRTGRPIGALWPTASPAQLTRLAIAEARARAALDQMERVEPKWRPTPSACETVEGTIAAAEAARMEAEARFLHLQTYGIIPGRYAAESIPSRGATRSFRVEERLAVKRIGEEFGCHTCGSKVPGTKSGFFVLDHQEPISRQSPTGARRLYPHCVTCSKRQAAG